MSGREYEKGVVNMKWDYREMQREILPGRETQDWIWEEIEKKAVTEGKKSVILPWLKAAASVAAAVALLVVLLPQTSWAEQITGFLKEFFYAGADVEQSIVSNIYEDEGKYGHVKMRIGELLSDGACVYFNICYEASDAEGEKWLAEQKFDGESIRFVNIDNEAAKSSGCEWELREQEELATEKTRYFSFYYRDTSGNFYLKDTARTLFYPMYNSQGIGKINITTNLDTVSYRLEGEGSPSKYYEPRYLVVSKLSYAVLGKDCGTSIKYINRDGALYYQMTKGYEEELDARFEAGKYGMDTVFIMADGSKLDASVGNGIGGEPIGVDGVDFVVTSGCFNSDENDWRKNSTIEDPDALTALELDGIHYDLVKEEISEE